MSRQLQIDYLKYKNNHKILLNQILEALKQKDSDARLLDINEIEAIRIISNKLWDALPDESESYEFENFKEQAKFGKKFIDNKTKNLKVIFHLGSDNLCFETTLENAWNVWYEIINLDSFETYNTCLFSRKLDWYIIRAGINLYPMIWNQNRYEKE